MSLITLSIADAEREYHGEPHASFVEPVLAALSLDPETYDELCRAMRRFVPAEDQERPLVFMQPGWSVEPFDAGIFMLDLAGRLIATQSTYAYPSRSGRVYFPGQPHGDLGIPYHFSDEWLITHEPDEWYFLSQLRRKQRQSTLPLDSRDVLYRQVLEFIVGQCELARGGTIGRADRWMPPPNWEWQQLTHRVNDGAPPNVADGVAEIHARWLMTPRADLRGRTPREVLLTKRVAIDRDLADREFQWSIFGSCPPELWREATTFRCGGYGTHELVVYYELIRHLLWQCWNLMIDTPGNGRPCTVSQTIQQLTATRDEWLQTPNFSDYGGQTPAAIIDRERARIPLMIQGNPPMIDPDCPLCRMLAESADPAFWHIDIGNLDDDFPFSFHPTYDEWRQEQIERAALRVRRTISREDLVVNLGTRSSRVTAFTSLRSPRPSPRDSEAATYSSNSVQWIELRSQFNRLREELGSAADADTWVSQLDVDFELLDEAMNNDPVALIGHVALRCNEHLAAIASAYTNLQERCERLQQQLSQLVLRLIGAKS